MRVLDFVTSILKAFGFDRYDIFVSTKPADASGTDEQWEVATAALKKALETRGLPYQIDPGEGDVLRPEDRHQDQGLARPRVAVLDDPGGLPQPEPLRPRVHRRGRQGAPAGDAPPGPPRKPRALLRRAHRALRGRVPALARAGAGRRHPGDRGAPRLRAQGGREAARTRASGSTSTTGNEKLGYKIREAQVQKVPYMLVVGDKEVESRTRGRAPPPRRRPRRRPDGGETFGARVAPRSRTERASPARKAPRRLSWRCLIDNKTVRINDRIRAKEVRVIDEDGGAARHHAAPAGADASPRRRGSTSSRSRPRRPRRSAGS